MRLNCELPNFYPNQRCADRNPACFFLLNTIGVIFAIFDFCKRYVLGQSSYQDQLLSTQTTEWNGSARNFARESMEMS